MDSPTNIQKILSSSECLSKNGCVLFTAFHGLKMHLSFLYCKDIQTRLLHCFVFWFFMELSIIEYLLKEQGTETITMNKTVCVLLRALMGRMQVSKQLL